MGHEIINILRPYKTPRWKSIRRVLKSLERGFTLHRACECAGITWMTFWRWRQRWGRLDQMMDNILDARGQMVEDAMMKTAMQGNFKAQQFFLMNRNRKRFNKSPDAPQVGVNVTVNNNGKLTDEDIALRDRIRADIEAGRV
jgi:hypothetical protein